jgi:hypothetical protein
VVDATAWTIAGVSRLDYFSDINCSKQINIVDMALIRNKITLCDNWCCLVGGCDNVAPMVSETTPSNGATVSSNLTSVSVTFTESVSGVVASSLTVNGSAASGVSGSGVGPYVFTVTDPPSGAVNLVLLRAGITDSADNVMPGNYTWSCTRE